MSESIIRNGRSGLKNKVILLVSVIAIAVVVLVYIFLKQGVDNTDYGPRNTEMVKLPTSVSAKCLTGTINVGSPSQKLTVLFDTGSSSFWVPDESCVGTSCQAGITKFDTRLSSTYQSSSKTGSIKYVDGSFSNYKISSDNVTFGGLSWRQNLGAAYQSTGKNPLGGIIGIRAPGQPMDSVDLTQWLWKKGFFPISFLYDRTTFQSGQITMGQIDKNYIQGGITWIELNSDRSYWNVDFKTISIQGGSQILSSTISAIFDTGSTLSTLPQSVFDAYNSANGNILQYSSTGYTIPCQSAQNLKPLQLTFGSKTIDFPWNNQIYMDGNICYSTFGRADKSNDYIMIGVTFLSNYYVIFDYDKERIGLATSGISTNLKKVIRRK